VKASTTNGVVLFSTLEAAMYFQCPDDELTFELLWESLDMPSVIRASIIVEHEMPLNNIVHEPWNGTRFPVDTWIFDPVTLEFSVLHEFNPQDLHVNECQKDGRRALVYDKTTRELVCSYERYCAWTKAGYIAPPISVIRDPYGKLLSQSRRRTTVAQDLNLASILGWYSHSTATRFFLWTPDDINKDAVREEVRRMWRKFSLEMKEVGQ
jgi:hypothetical protein